PGVFPLDADGATKLTIPNEKEIFGLGVNSIKGTDDRYQWICTRSGLYGFDPNFVPLFKGKRLLNGKLISDFLRDREGNYWIATLRSGLHMIPNLQLKHYKQENSVLPDDRITALSSAPNEDLLLGFQSGEGAIFSPATQDLTIFRGPLNREVPTILYDTNRDHVWLSSGSYLCSFDLTGQMLVKRRNSATKFMSLFGENLLRAYPQGADAIRLTPEFGKEDPLTPDFFQRYPHSDERGYLSLELISERSWAILGDSTTGNMWVGGEKDLYLVSPEGAVPIRLPQKGGTQQSIIAKDLTQDESGMIWVGTQSQGVIGLEGQEVRYHFSSTHLLPTNQCRAVEAVAGVLWIGSDQGIIRLVPETGEVHLFNSKHGLTSNNIRDLSLSGDTLYAATPKGLIEMPTKIVREPSAPPPIFLTGLALWEQDTVLEAGVSLSYDQNNLHFEYLGLAYRTRNEFSYRYRLLGLDSSWVQVPASQRIARFPSLPPGDYTFEVVADTGEGVLSSQPARFPFSIALPFWMRWWFWGTCLFVVASILALIFQARISSIKSRNYVQQQLRSAQLAALKSQMNPHFIFNALNSIQDFILLNEKRQANAYLGKFADLMRLYLNMSNQRGIILADEIQAMRLYLDLEGIRFGDNFQYEIEVDDSVDTEATEIPAMVIQPYIENAIKHGLLHKKGERLLRIFFAVLSGEEVLYCEIHDNGVGRKRTQEIQMRNPVKRKSFATDATARRLDLLNYGRKTSIGVDILDLYDANDDACGTQVNIRIPLESLPTFSD
ncbi:MAG: histidine kinase, partial [Bacteroidota bacterium]